MTRKAAIVALAKCFARLPKRDRTRLKHHAEAKTPICCGIDAYMFTDGHGGG